MIDLVDVSPRWPRVPLGELCDIRGGYPAPQEDAAFEHGEVPFVRMKDVGRYHFTNDLRRTEQALNRTYFETRKYELTPRNSILMPRSGSVALNHRAVLKVDAVVVSHLCALVPRSQRVDVDYLYRFLCIVDLGKLTKRTTGLDSIAFSDLRAVAVPLPTPAEQTKIANILNEADVLRTKRQAALDQVKNFRVDIFTDLFGDPSLNPKTWAVSTVGDVADVQGGLQLSSVRQSYPVRVPYLRVANVYRGYLDLGEVKTLQATEAEVARTTLAKDDLLVVEGHGNPNEIGRGALWDGSIERCVHQNHIIRVRFNQEQILPTYGCEYLNSPGGRRHLLRSGKTTSGLNTISVSEVRAAPIAVPPLTVQKEFVRRVTAVTKVQRAYDSSLKVMDELFSSLQYRAFAGEL